MSKRLLIDFILTAGPFRQNDDNIYVPGQVKSYMKANFDELRSETKKVKLRISIPDMQKIINK